MKEVRLRKIVKSSNERDMLLKMISLFRHNEDYFGRLEFLERCAIGTHSDKVIMVLEERLKDVEGYLKHLLNDKD